MKKNLLLALTFVSALTCSLNLTSCGGSSVSAFAIPEGGFDTTQEVTINFYTTQGKTLKDKTTAYIAEFNKIYPNIHVEMPLDSMSYDSLRDQIKTEIAVDAGPDVAYCYPDHVALYNKKKVVVALDNLIKDTTYGLGLTQEQIDDFIPGYYNEGRQFGDGLMYTMPYSKSTELMYYNADFFEKNNLSVPDHWFSNGDDDKTSVEYVCAEIKKIDPNSIPLGYDSSDNWFITMCAQYGSDYTSATGNHYLFDNETNRSFISKFKEWYSKGWITTADLNGNSNTSNLLKSTDTVKSYMSIGSSAGSNYNVPDDIDTDNGKALPFKVGIATIPQVDVNHPKVISQGPSICVFNQGDPQKVLASWLFVRYMITSVAYQAEFSMASGYVPVIKSVNDNPTFAAHLQKSDMETKTSSEEKTRLAALAAKVCMQQEDAYFTSPAFYGSSTARSEVGSLLDAAISGSKSIDKAFLDALSECSYKG